MILDFAQKVIALCFEFGGSITSWGRTQKRNKAVGGHIDSWHMNWLGIDMVLDDMGDVTVDKFTKKAKRMGIRVVDERKSKEPHLHLQPLI